MNFVSTEIIVPKSLQVDKKAFENDEVKVSDVDTHTDTTSSSSSYAPSDQVNKPIDYTCSIEMRELDDVLRPPLPIKNPRFGISVANALKKCQENQLSPTDCVNRLQASSIFQAAGPFLHFDEEDPNHRLCLSQ
ncbi:hypothetical protein MBANPS3_012448 [Mucor bainieri]